ncbi:MAG: 3'-5' exonuclease [Candidatus Lokiarchaeota archaeon]|nr:3'-5' exonuclease [Candidatus Lokiarchaeota archaeon]
MTKIYVFDIETTGLSPYKDKILEIGIASLDTQSNYVEGEVFWTINEEVTGNEWVFKNSSLTIEDIKNSNYSIQEVIGLFTDFIRGKILTAYNKIFDFGFMNSNGFNPSCISDYPDIMLLAKPILNIRHPTLRIKRPSVQECLNHFHINKLESHRALDDAILEAKILLKILILKGEI